VALNLYVGTFFAIQATPNLQKDYTSALINMKAIDTPLHDILHRFWQTWQMIDIDQEHIFLEFYPLVESLVDQINSWIADTTGRMRSLAT
jgi:hypothetical protein